MTRALTVWWEGAVVGSLALDADGQMQFTYAAEWLAGERSPALSCSLPKRREPFRRRLCRPFFEGLLPEGTQRDAVARVLGVSPDNEFGLLEGLGGDVAGALTLWPEGETPPLRDYDCTRTSPRHCPMRVWPTQHPTTDYLGAWNGVAAGPPLPGRCERPSAIVKPCRGAIEDAGRPGRKDKRS